MSYIDEEKELSGELDAPQAEEPEEGATPAENEEPTEVAEENTPEKTPSEETISVAGQTFKSYDDLIKSYGELKSLYGKQASELGELRKKVEPQEPKEELEYDPFDPDSVTAYIDRLVEHKVMESYEKVTQAKDFEQATRSVLNQLKSKHPDITNEQWISIAEFADQNGITRLDHAFHLWNRDNEIKEAIERGRKEALAELSKETGDNLAGKAGGSSGKKVDYDSMTPGEWARLSVEERQRALQEAM